MFLLHRLDERDVFLLGLGGGDALFHSNLLPGFVFVFALMITQGSAGA